MAQKALSLCVQRLGAHHLEQGLPRHVAVAFVVAADVKRKESSHVGELILGRLLNQFVRDARVGGEVVLLEIILNKALP